MASGMARRGGARALSACDGRGLGCTLMEMIGGFGRHAGDGVVVSV
jgi:hypothetical protein